MTFLNIDLNHCYQFMCAVIVRKLREANWPEEAISGKAEVVIAKCKKHLDDQELLKDLAHHAATMHAQGADQETIQVMADAAYAILAVRVADDVNRSMIAESN